MMITILLVYLNLKILMSKKIFKENNMFSSKCICVNILLFIGYATLRSFTFIICGI